MAKSEKNDWSACKKCAICCKEPIVPVTDADVRRLTKGTGMPSMEIVRFWNHSDMEFDIDSSMWVRLAYGKRSMGLRRKNEKCMFLGDDNRCTVYEHRPQTCRTFPYEIYLDEDDKMTDVKVNRAVKRCTGTFTKKTCSEGVIADAIREEAEDETYWDKVDKWNAKGGHGSVEEFLKYIGLK